MLYRAATTGDEVQYSVTFRYLAEGAANIIYTILPGSDEGVASKTFVLVRPNGTIYHPKVSLGRVLRVSKGLDKTLSGEEVKDQFENEIKQHFDGLHDVLMSPQLVHLDDAVLSRLDSELTANSSRSKENSTITLPLGTVGLLLEDMSGEGEVIEQMRWPEALAASARVVNSSHKSRVEPDSVLGRGLSLTLEMKPKWLSQSPNAPPGAQRCRTCALRALREKKTGMTVGPYICPLKLSHTNGSPRSLKKSLESITTFIEIKVQKALDDFQIVLPPKVQQGITQNVVNFLGDKEKRGYMLIDHLRKKQEECDKTGVLLLSENDDHGSLRLAMTLRDCSLFLVIQIDEEYATTRIWPFVGDLDLKSGAKIDDWKAKEQELIDGGWYLDDGNAAADPYCYLSVVGEVPTPGSEELHLVTKGLRVTVDDAGMGITPRIDTLSRIDSDIVSPGGGTARPLKSGIEHKDVGPQVHGSEVKDGNNHADEDGYANTNGHADTDDQVPVSDGYYGLDTFSRGDPSVPPPSPM